jgi:hypothetical protein
MYEDPEITAMSRVLEAFTGLENDQIKRIIEWITSKFGITEPLLLAETQPPASVPETAPAAAEEKVVVQEAAQAAAPAPETAAPQPEAPETQPDKKVDPLKGLGLKRYKSIETLFLSSNTKTVGSKVLLAAAYLQEKLNFEEISSFDVNSRLKKMGYGVSNISNTLNTLIKKDPPLMIQTKKEGDSKQAKRKFRVTEEGLQEARTYLRGKGKEEDES